MKEIKVNRIILGQFIDMLIEAYGKGADFIDLVAQQGDENEDRLGILIREEYVNHERYDNYVLEKRVRDEKPPERLTNDELNQLLKHSIN